jgi:hypothetical protein
VEPATDPVLPAFGGASVTGIVPAVVGGDRDGDLPPWLPEPVRGARTVVLLVLDGVGWNALHEHADRLPTLTALTGGPITTVVPSTTATALTSICTGLAPAQHGVLGYRIVVGGEVLNVLRWSTSQARPPDPFDVQRHTAFLGREVPVLTKSEFRNSGFSHAHLRGGHFIGWSTPSVLVEHVRRLAEAGDRFVYAYYPGVDNVAHEFGLRNGFYERELEFADRLVGDLLAVLPASATLLVTSDHGQVHVEREDWIALDDLAAMVDVMAGDGRFRYLYARRGAARELADAARALLGDRAWVRTRREVLDEGWIGAGATGSVPGRVGDVVLASRDASAFVDPALPVEVRLRSAHGSLTPDEMWVPLVGGAGRA